MIVVFVYFHECLLLAAGGQNVQRGIVRLIVEHVAVEIVIYTVISVTSCIKIKTLKTKCVFQMKKYIIQWGSRGRNRGAHP